MFIRKHWIGLIVFLVAIVGVSLYYLQTRPPKDPIVIIKPVEPLPKSEEKAPVGDTSQSGHFHADGTWREGPHDAEEEAPEIAKERVSDVSTPTPPQRQYNNPHPFENVPVDLRDFEATKAAMIENINFVKANWDPKVYDLDVDTADALTFNIASAARATQLGLFTPEQALELNRLRHDLLAFKGIDGSRVQELYSQGYTREEAFRISTEETLQRQGVK